MKKLIPFVYVFLFACVNRKSHLVDLQRKYIDSSEYYGAQRDSAAIKYAAGTWSADKEVEIEAPMVQRRGEFKRMADSIGLELKKY